MEGLIALMNSNYSKPVNLGNPDEYSMIDFARNIIESTGSRSKITHEDLPIDDPKKRCPDISRAQKELKWAPKVTLDEGLKKTISWFNKLI